MRGRRGCENSGRAVQAWQLLPAPRLQPPAQRDRSLTGAAACKVGRHRGQTDGSRPLSHAPPRSGVGEGSPSAHPAPPGLQTHRDREGAAGPIYSPNPSASAVDSPAVWLRSSSSPSAWALTPTGRGCTPLSSSAQPWPWPHPCWGARGAQTDPSHGPKLPPAPLTAVLGTFTAGCLLVSSRRDPAIASVGSHCSWPSQMEGAA